jgi:hypothetical protein
VDLAPTIIFSVVLCIDIFSNLNWLNILRNASRIDFHFAEKVNRQNQINHNFLNFLLKSII